MGDDLRQPDPGAARPFASGEAFGPFSLSVERRRGRPVVSYHYHDLYELVLLRGGSGHRMVGDSFRDVRGRDLILVGPGLPHGWSVLPGEAPDEAGVGFVVVLFTRESLGLEVLAKPEFAPVRGLLERAARGLAWADRAAAQVEPAVFALPDQPPAARFLAFLEVLGRLAALPADELVSSGYEARDVEREHAALARVLELVQQRYAAPIALAEAARAVHMSVPTFTRFFRRMTGTSFVQYLNRWRVRRACILLRETQRAVAEVAAACGFANLSHFNRQFRRRIGTTPSAYRRDGG